MGIATSAPPMNANEDIVEVIPLQDPSNILIRKASETANDKGIPLVFYTPEPTMAEQNHLTYRNILNLETNETERILISNSTNTEYLRKYTVVEPGNIYRQVVYKSDIDTSSWFDDALANEIDKLRKKYRSNEFEMELAQYQGDGSAILQHWQWEKTSVELISSVDDNGNGWTYESSYAWDLWASVADVDLDERYWMFEWIVASSVDDGDYKCQFGIGNRVGPWVSSRYIKNDAAAYGRTEQLHRHQPSTSTGTFSYSISTGIQATTTGPQVMFGASATWTGLDVSIDDGSLKSQDYTEWTETFRGPNYSTYPFWSGPCSASHNTYESYRAAQWMHDADDETGEWIQDTETTVSWHTDVHFYNLFIIVWDSHYHYSTDNEWTWEKITNN
jgi:hypothetical protein